jgi:ABC-type multidrug transport system ATPase subunit
LLGLLSGILIPQSGEIQIIDGLGSTKMTSVKPGMVGVVDQASTLFEHLTVQKNLTFAASLGGIPKEQHKAAVSEILERFRT